MSRLTYTDEELTEFENMDCPVKANDLVNQFCDNVCDEFQHNCPFMKMAQKLKAYEDKQEQGLLIDVPCKVGDTVYLADKIHGKVEVSIVEHIEYIVNTNANFPFTKIKGEGFCIFFDDFGKLAFLTRSEAEEALAKMGGKA